MSNFTIKVNLAKLDGASLQTNPNTGKRALIIPVDEADLFVGQNGAVYLDLAMWENRTQNAYGDTHSIKKSYSKEMRERLGADVVKAKPFLGNAKPMPNSNNNNAQDTAQAPSQTAPNWENW